MPSGPKKKTSVLPRPPRGNRNRGHEGLGQLPSRSRDRLHHRPSGRRGEHSALLATPLIAVGCKERRRTAHARAVLVFTHRVRGHRSRPCPASMRDTCASGGARHRQADVTTLFARLGGRHVAELSGSLTRALPGSTPMYFVQISGAVCASSCVDVPVVVETTTKKKPPTPTRPASAHTNGSCVV